MSSSYFFYKSILRKVSFNPYLFNKELKKAMFSLSDHESERLIRWASTYRRKSIKIENL